MARPPLPVGVNGRISTTRIADGPKGEVRFEAITRIRDADGVTRRVKRVTPDGVSDNKDGDRAATALKVALRDRPSVVAEAGALSSETRVAELWARYRAQLVDGGRSSLTLRDYDRQAKRIVAGLGGLQVREMTVARIDAHLREVAAHNGVASAKKVRTILSGMLGVAVRLGALPTNPVREAGDLTGKRKKRAQALSAENLGQLLSDIRHSSAPCPVVLSEAQIKKGIKTTSKPGQVPTVAEFAAKSDLADVVTLFAATGCRIGELLAIRWKDVDLDARTVEVSGKVIRIIGKGLVREDVTKTAAGERTLPLPQFAVTMLKQRERGGLMVFESRDGTVRDPDTVQGQWRQVRSALGLDWVTSHTFRKSVATILDEEGLSARVAADQLGHAQVSMTQDVYLGRGRTHSAVADALDAAVTGRSE
ncbi:site-specific integrase [Rhodococcus sp. UNC363MFTsu5.1]|uniref:site-specific integrase n=1 Tax=Rhodococcus sp. UNC363MFTsu5.1 TaxID=1449069 RepID=UPI000691B2D3|nr:site-specific integrase [Rhodococcus sp. UNC363MFTsu5.1]